MVYFKNTLTLIVMWEKRNVENVTQYFIRYICNMIKEEMLKMLHGILLGLIVIWENQKC